MKAVRVDRAGGTFQLTEEQIREPQPGAVRIRVQACGVCHSDVFTKEGGFPGIVYPRSPGHEVAGVIDAVGEGAGPWKVGDRVGVGWHGGHCRVCEPCRRGDFVCCEKLQIPGISYDGGYAEFMCAPIESLARIPSELTPEDAAPIRCAQVSPPSTHCATAVAAPATWSRCKVSANSSTSDPIRQQIRFRNRRDRSRRRQEESRAEAGRAYLHRQCIAGCRERVARPGRRPGNPGNCAG